MVDRAKAKLFIFLRKFPKIDWKITQWQKEYYLSDDEIILQMRFLDLSNHKLHDLPRELVLLKNLTTLNLATNNFTQIPRLIEHFRKLKFLGLDNNQLKEIPNFIYEMNLSRLSIRKNPISIIPRKYQSLVLEV